MIGESALARNRSIAQLRHWYSNRDHRVITSTFRGRWRGTRILGREHVGSRNDARGTLGGALDDEQHVLVAHLAREHERKVDRRSERAGARRDQEQNADERQAVVLCLGVLADRERRVALVELDARGERLHEREVPSNEALAVTVGVRGADRVRGIVGERRERVVVDALVAHRAVLPAIEREVPLGGVVGRHDAAVGAAHRVTRRNADHRRIPMGLAGAREAIAVDRAVDIGVVKVDVRQRRHDRAAHADARDGDALGLVEVEDDVARRETLLQLDAHVGELTLDAVDVHEHHRRRRRRDHEPIGRPQLQRVEVHDVERGVVA